MREIENVVVGSIEALLEEMVPPLGFQRAPVYRGQASAAWSLLPSLYREEVAKTEHKSWAEVEACSLLAFKRQAGGDLDREPGTELEWMALGAHHGLPTRLTAWTDNALVALFFATASAPAGEDGAVWRLMPGEAALTIAHDYEQIPDSVRLYRPQRPDAAMRNQRVGFLAHPLPIEDAAPETLEEIYELGGDRFVLSKLIVPAEWKAYLRRRLVTMGVDHRALFPGLAGLCHDLREELYSQTDAYEWVFPR